MTATDLLAVPVDIDERTQGFIGRRWVFERIDAWLADGSRKLFVAGGPGTGKSALAGRLAQISNGDLGIPTLSHLGAGCITYAHFCQSRNTPRINPITFVENLSARLAAISDDFREVLNRSERREISISADISGDVSGQVAVGSGIVQVGAGATVFGDIAPVAVHIHDLAPAVAFDEAVSKPLAAIGDDSAEARVLVLIDALDEALGVGRDNLVGLLADLLNPTAELPSHLRFLVTARSNEPRVLDRLGRPDVDLIADAPPDVDDVREYAVSRLQSVQEPGRATLADRVATHSKGNFLYARYVLDDLVDHPERVEDPATFSLPENLLAIYREFLQRELAPDRTDEDWEERYRPVLGLLVVAQGDGLLPVHISGAANVNPSQAADIVDRCSQFLFGSRPKGPFRIYHQSFRDFLLTDPTFQVYAGEAARALAEYFIEEWKGAWLQCDDPHAVAYTPSYLVEAIEGAQRKSERAILTVSLTDLLGDFDFLEAKVSRGGVDAVLADLRFATEFIPETGRIATTAGMTQTGGGAIQRIHRLLLRESAHLRPPSPVDRPGYTTQQLCLQALVSGDTELARRAGDTLTRLPSPQLIPRWTNLQLSEQMIGILSGHSGPVNSVAITLDSTSVVTGGDDGTVRVWDLLTGTALGDPLLGHKGKVAAVALGAVNDRPVALSGGEDGTVRVWDLLTGTALGDPLLGHKGKVAAVALGAMNDRPVALSGGEDEKVRVWDIISGRLASAPLSLEPAGAVTAIATGEANGQTVAVVGSWNLTLQIWDLGTSVPLCKPLIGHTAGVEAVTMGTVDERPVVVSGSRDETLRVWDLHGRLLRTIETGSSVLGLALGTLRGGSVALCGDDVGSVRVWDLSASSRLNEPLLRAGRLTAVTAGNLDSRPIVVSSSDGGLVGVRDLDGSLLRTIETASAVFAVACGEVDGRPIAVYGGWDKTALACDLHTGATLGKPLSGHDGWIAAIAVGEMDGRPIAVSAGGDQTLRIWDLTTGKPAAKPLRGHNGTVACVALGEIDGRPIIVSGSWDQTIRLWDVRAGIPLGAPWSGHTAEIATVALGKADGHPVVASGGWDGTVRLWDARSGAQLATFHGHTAGVTAVAVSEVAGELAIISGGGDEAIRVWDRHGAAVRIVEVGSAVWAIALAGPKHVAIATSSGLIVAELMGFAAVH